jgi:hypothetical protein
MKYSQTNNLLITIIFGLILSLSHFLPIVTSQEGPFTSPQKRGKKLASNLWRNNNDFNCRNIKDYIQAANDVLFNTCETEFELDQDVQSCKDGVKEIIRRYKKECTCTHNNCPCHWKKDNKMYRSSKFECRGGRGCGRFGRGIGSYVADVVCETTNEPSFYKRCVRNTIDACIEDATTKVEYYIAEGKCGNDVVVVTDELERKVKETCESEIEKLANE